MPLRFKENSPWISQVQVYLCDKASLNPPRASKCDLAGLQSDSCKSTEHTMWYMATLDEFLTVETFFSKDL